MKLLRFGPASAERPGLLDQTGTIRDLSSVIADLSGAALGSASLRRIAAIDPASLPAVLGPVRIGPCVGHVGHFIAVGLNYVDHAHETNSPIPAEPILFNKAVSCLVGPDDDIVLPRGSTKTDWEVEIAIVIGEAAYDVAQETALDIVAGYCICHDVSEREYQIERGGQWMKGKSSPTFGPLGPWLVTKDEIDNVQDLGLWLDVDGERMQTGSTKTMIFGCAELVSYISRYMALQPGDVITTGTPPGVGLAKKPPRFLCDGQTVTLGIDGLGKQTQHVRAR